MYYNDKLQEFHDKNVFEKIQTSLVETFFRTIPAILLLKPYDHDCDRAYHQKQVAQAGKIFADALKLGFALSCLKSELSCCHTLSRLREEHLDIFSHDSLDIRPHTYMKLNADGLSAAQQRRFDNQPIRLLTFPAIIAKGNEDGEDYDNTRYFWAKPEIWIEDSPSRF